MHRWWFFGELRDNEKIHFAFQQCNKVQCWDKKLGITTNRIIELEEPVMVSNSFQRTKEVKLYNIRGLKFYSSKPPVK
jgi:hypothetical protein